MAIKQQTYTIPLVRCAYCGNILPYPCRNETEAKYCKDNIEDITHD